MPALLTFLAAFTLGLGITAAARIVGRQLLFRIGVPLVVLGGIGLGLRLSEWVDVVGWAVLPAAVAGLAAGLWLGSRR